MKQSEARIGLQVKFERPPPCDCISPFGILSQKYVISTSLTQSLTEEKRRAMLRLESVGPLN